MSAWLSASLSCLVVSVSFVSCLVLLSCLVFLSVFILSCRVLSCYRVSHFVRIPPYLVLPRNPECFSNLVSSIPVRKREKDEKERETEESREESRVEQGGRYGNAERERYHVHKNGFHLEGEISLGGRW